MCHCLQYATLSFAFALVRLLHVWPLCQLELAHDSHELVEGLIHIDARLCTALDVWRAQLSAQLLSLLQGHPPLALQIGFVAHHQHRKLIAVLDSQNLFLELCHLLEAGVVGQREDEQEALARAHVLLPHGTKLLLASRVEN